MLIKSEDEASPLYVQTSHRPRGSGDLVTSSGPQSLSSSTWELNWAKAELLPQTHVKPPSVHEVWAWPWRRPVSQRAVVITLVCIVQGQVRHGVFIDSCSQGSFICVMWWLAPCSPCHLASSLPRCCSDLWLSSRQRDAARRSAAPQTDKEDKKTDRDNKKINNTEPLKRCHGNSKPLFDWHWILHQS